MYIWEVKQQTEAYSALLPLFLWLSNQWDDDGGGDKDNQAQPISQKLLRISKYLHHSGTQRQKPKTSGTLHKQEVWSINVSLIEIYVTIMAIHVYFKKFQII